VDTDTAAVVTCLRAEYNIEIASGIGGLAGEIW
jgi:hypothetical protein